MATYSPGDFTALLAKSKIRHKATRLGAYRPAVTDKALRSIYRLTQAKLVSNVASEGLVIRPRSNAGIVYVTGPGT